jgi:hypothetical protein
MSDERVFGLIDRHFLDGDRLRRVAAFSNVGRQVEGWFKAEMIYLLADAKGYGLIDDFKSEAVLPDQGRRRVDFRVQHAGRTIYLELKTLFHGKQANSVIPLDIYLYRDDIGIWPDLQKLGTLPPGAAFSLLFVHPRPDAAFWARALSRARERYREFDLAELTRVSDYPAELYIAKIAVRRSEADPRRANS